MAPAVLDPARPTSPRASRFADLEITHDRGVLEPRPWTAVQSRWARRLLASLPGGPVLELCCGAGHIGLAAVRGTRRRLVQVDASARACAWAHHNAVANGLAAQVEVRHADVAEALAAHERFGLVLADPPYLRSDDVDHHPDDPRDAVDGGDDGLAVPEHVLAVAARHVVPGGAVLLQARGPRQVDALEPAIARLGLGIGEVHAVDVDRAVALLRPRRPARP